MKDPTHVLDGLRVLSFCHYLQGPAATQYLADMGADVIKVEPLTGAFERHWSGADIFVDGVSAFFLCANRNKRSLSIDIKHAEGKAIILRLVEQFDVVVENFRSGVMDRLGLGFEDLRKANPRIIYASASGFGSTGPSRSQPGQDLLIQARSGLIAASGSADLSPTAAGCAAIDQHGASLLAMGILGAYARLLKTGEGTRVEASLLNAGIDLQAEALTLYYSGHNNADVLKRDSHLATWFHAAPYGVYKIADAHIVLSLNSLPSLAKALANGPPTNFAELEPYQERDLAAERIAIVLADWRFDALAVELETAGIWFQRVQNYDDLRQDPQVLHNGTFQEVQIGTEIATLVNHPLRYNGHTPPIQQIALTAGEHTVEILGEIGLSRADIDDLVRRGVVNGKFSKTDIT